LGLRKAKVKERGFSIFIQSIPNIFTKSSEIKLRVIISENPKLESISLIFSYFLYLLSENVGLIFVCGISSLIEE